MLSRLAIAQAIKACATGYWACLTSSGSMMAGDLDLNRPACRECIDAATVDVRHEITETIDAQHAARELATRHSRFWNIEHLP